MSMSMSGAELDSSGLRGKQNNLIIPAAAAMMPTEPAGTKEGDLISTMNMTPMINENYTTGNQQLIQQPGHKAALLPGGKMSG